MKCVERYGGTGDDNIFFIIKIFAEGRIIYIHILSTAWQALGDKKGRELCFNKKQRGTNIFGLRKGRTDQ
jgi:hypothetical protein